MFADMMVLMSLLLVPMDESVINTRNVMRCMSYNCRGFNEVKKSYVSKMLEHCDILFLQEHWLSESQLDGLGSISPTHVSFGISGFGCSDVLSGRPYGGCAILWRRSLVFKVESIGTDSRRVCCMLLSCPEFKLLCINVYMPYEDDVTNLDEFSLQLAIVDDLIDRNPDCHVMLGGDFNVDFSRNWTHTDLLNDFCLRTNVSPIIRHSLSTIDYTYNFSMKSFSVIDHFILSEQLFSSTVKSISVIHDVDNTSDHDPLCLELDLTVARCTFDTPKRMSKPSWCKATSEHIELYKHTLCCNLHKIALPVEALLCRDVLCHDNSHINLLNGFVSDISHACLSAGAVSLPSTTRCGTRGHIPGWTEFVAPARDKAIMWHKIWVESGRPRSGVVADIMRKTRATYHYTIRRVRRNVDDIVNKRFADALLDKNGRDFWAEAKKLRHNTASVSSVVDGLCTPDDIADLFASNYQHLYTSVAYDADDMNRITKSIDDSLRCSGVSAQSSVNCTEVLMAIRKLKAAKNDGNIGLSSDFFRYGCDDLAVYISLLFSALLIHGTSPHELATSTVIPIPKGKGLNPTDSANYRGITLSSIYGKIFDLIMLYKFSDQLSTSSLQFGFKAKRSTSMCTMVLNEVISYYSKHGSLYCTMLDATKAFDRVNYCRLFRDLLDRDLPREYLRLMLNMYTSHVTRISWNGICSALFLVKNGVKQGGVISPVLFCIYIDRLLDLLRRSGFGCFVGRVFLGALAYADDIVLLAPTHRAMRNMLALCDRFADEYNVVFNAKKSKCLYITSRAKRLRFLSAPPQFTIGGNNIEFVDKWLHLGHIISAVHDNKEEIISKRNTLCGQINNVLCYFGKRDPITKLSLLKAYCSSFYGSVLWDLSHPSMDVFCAAWRKGLRRVWNLPYNTHSALLPPLCGLLPLMDELACRSSTFISSCLYSECEVVSFVARHGVYYSRMLSPIGRNSLFCCSRFDVSLRDILCISKPFVWTRYRSKLTASCLSTVSLILELLFVKIGYFSISCLSQAELSCLIDFICTG